jgi:uncharacterized protein (TIGR03083 family)
MGDSDVWIRQVTASGRVILGVLTEAPDAPVVHCPGWTVADLVRHHGDVVRWVATIVRTGEEDPIEYTGPADPVELAPWYNEGVSGLVDMLASSDPARPCWTFGRPPAVTGFWIRRQALEAAVHAWDAQRAIEAQTDLATDLAVAGIDEVLEFFFPRQIDLGRTPPLSAPVGLHATDVDRHWEIAGAADEPQARIAAPASHLLLLLWRRTDLDDPVIDFTGTAVARAEVGAVLFAP